jgi:hypothetical protein
LTALAIAAWLLDETPLAVRTFDEAVQSWYATGPLPDGLDGVIALAYFEYGRWDQARAVCADLVALPAAAGLGHAVACAHAIEAMIVASQGDAAPARALADEALRRQLEPKWCTAAAPCSPNPSTPNPPSWRPWPTPEPSPAFLRNSSRSSGSPPAGRCPPTGEPGCPARERTVRSAG